MTLSARGQVISRVHENEKEKRTKTAAADASNALKLNEILVYTLQQYVGSGEWLYVALVCKDWKKAAEGLKMRRARQIRRETWYRINSRTTTLKSIMASLSRVQMAFEHGFDFLRSAFEVGLYGDVHSLQQCKEYGMDMSYALLEGCALSGDVNKLQIAVESYGLEVSQKLMYFAGSSGSIEMLKWLQQQGLAYDARLADNCAEHGHLAAIQYLHGKELSFTPSICALAAKSGNLELLQWLQQRGFAVDVEHYRGGSMYQAVDKGHTNMMLYLHEQGVQLQQSTMEVAARSGCLESVMYLREHGVQYDQAAMKAAAETGHTHIMQHLLDGGVQFDDSMMVVAAGHGQLSTCQWLRAQHNYPWDVQCTAAAADVDVGFDDEHANAETLQWLIRNGCPFNAVDCGKFVDNHGSGSIETLELIFDTVRQAGAAVSADDMTALLNHAGTWGALEMVKFLRSHGAAWPQTLGEDTDGGGMPWMAICLRYARSEGCEHPALEDPSFDSEQDGDDENEAGANAAAAAVALEDADW